MNINKIKEDKYEMDERTLNLLLDAYYTMEALQCGGVDNSNDYCDSINRYREEEEKRRGRRSEIMIKKYIKKPVQIEAIQLKEDNIIEVFDFLDGANYKETKSSEELEDFSEAMLEQGYIEIETLEGMMKASFGDYIIKGVKGEFYPCKPDIFIATYEEVR